MKPALSLAGFATTRKALPILGILPTPARVWNVLSLVAAGGDGNDNGYERSSTRDVMGGTERCKRRGAAERA